jgi:hypothetical protein
MIDGAATILVPAGRASKEREWSTKSDWNDWGQGHQEFLTTYLKQTLQEVEATLHDVLSSIASRIHEFLKENKLELANHVAARETVARDAISVVSRPDLRYM